jgi:hypothetical protein
MPTTKTRELDPTLAFQFLEVVDTGGDACCPHCGAEGRYIYYWHEYGKGRSAMAGCYAALTGKLNKDDFSKFMEVLSRKQATNKPLNGWQKTVVRMNKYIQDNNNDDGKVNWALQKIKEAGADQKRFAFQKGR